MRFHRRRRKPNGASKFRWYIDSKGYVRFAITKWKDGVIFLHQEICPAPLGLVSDPSPVPLLRGLRTLASSRRERDVVRLHSPPVGASSAIID